MSNLLKFRDQVEITTGDTIRVHQTVKEGDKTRTQIFEGVVIRIRGHEGLKSFTVRKIGANGIGVERIFPELAPTVTKVEVKKKGKVRRAVLTYLRKRIGSKATKIEDVFVKGAQKNEEQAIVIKKGERVEGEADEAAKETKLNKATLEEKAAREAKKADKEKKKAKKKKKVERKEKVFVR